MHKAAALNSQPLDRVVAELVNSQLPLHKVPAGEAVAAAVKQVAAAPAVAAVLKQVAVEGAVAAADNKLTLPQQAPETFARFFLTGAGIWACCAAIRKSI